MSRSFIDAGSFGLRLSGLSNASKEYRIIGPQGNRLAVRYPGPAMTPVVELVGARKRFGDVEAVRGVDLTIAEGEMVALLGPNGAGKTTSIGLMLGLRRPTDGQARLFGHDPADRRARSRCGGMLQEAGTAGGGAVRGGAGLVRAHLSS